MFRRRARQPEAADPWVTLTQTLGLHPLEESELDDLRERLPMDLTLVGPVMASPKEPETPRLLVLHVHPAAAKGGTTASARPAFLLQGTGSEVAVPAFRAFPRSHPLVTSLQASRTGGREWLTGHEAFDARIALVAREESAATWLAAAPATPLRTALMELLIDEALPEGVLIVGAGQVSWHVQRPLETPVADLQSVAEQLFGVWVGLRVANS